MWLSLVFHSLAARKIRLCAPANRAMRRRAVHANSPIDALTIANLVGAAPDFLVSYMTLAPPAPQKKPMIRKNDPNC